MAAMAEYDLPDKALQTYSTRIAYVTVPVQAVTMVMDTVPDENIWPDQAGSISLGSSGFQGA